MAVSANQVLGPRHVFTTVIILVSGDSVLPNDRLYKIDYSSAASNSAAAFAVHKALL